jgi:hypothetical protein
VTNGKHVVLSPSQLATMQSVLNAIDPEKRHVVSERLHASVRRFGIRRPSDQLFSAALNDAMRGVWVPPRGEE